MTTENENPLSPEDQEQVGPNQYWRRRLNHGKPRAYETPEDLMEACVEYFEWCDINPLFEDKLMAVGGDAVNRNLIKKRAPTLQGLTTHLGIHRVTWNKWRTSQPDFADVIAMVDNAMEAIQLEGASAGIFNGQIISRLIGLVDKTESKGVTGLISLDDVENTDSDKLKETLRRILE